MRDGLKFVFLILLISLPVSANTQEPLVWGFSTFVPYLYLDNQGEPRGQYAEIVKNVFEHADVEYEVIESPNRRSKKLIDNGIITFGIGPKTILDNPEEYYFSKPSVSRIELRTYWQGEKKPINNAVELRGSRAILISSYTYSGIRDFITDEKNNIELAVDVEDHTRALQALILDRGDYMLGYKGPTEDALAELKVDKIYSSNLLTMDMYFLISKSVENGQAIMDRLDASYQYLYVTHKKQRSLENILNFRETSKQFSTSGMPNDEDIVVISREGYQHIINLIPGDFSDEQRQVEELNMSFAHIPIEWSSPSIQDFMTFTALMQGYNSEKTLLHCQKNYRASAFGYLYETLILGHEEPIAKQNLLSVWTPNKIWQTYIDRVIEHYKK